MDDTLRNYTQTADYPDNQPVSRPEGLEHTTSPPANPVVALSIVLLVSFSLWWALWLVISALISALS